jgi:hypothetical protein
MRRCDSRWPSAAVTFILLLLLHSGTAAGGAATGPIALHPQNPHYFLFRSKPTILITSGEHYGALLNLPACH